MTMTVLDYTSLEEFYLSLANWSGSDKLSVLAKQVSQDFMHSFLGLISLGNVPFPAQGRTTSSIVSGLGQVGEVRQPRD